MNITIPNRRKVSPAYCLAYTVIITTGIAVMTMFYFMFIEGSYLSYPNSPFASMQPAIHAGETIPLNITRCNSDSVAHIYTVSRTLERVVKQGNKDDYWMLADIQFHIEPGCHPAVSDAHIAPADLPPSDWRLVGMANTQGALISHIVRFESLPFKVLAALPVVVKQGERGEPGAKGATGATGKTGATGAKGTLFGGK
jgi:hypothetical protein